MCIYLSATGFLALADLKKHAYAELPPSENHASQGKNVRTNTCNSGFPRALLTVSNFMGNSIETQKAKEETHTKKRNTLTHIPYVKYLDILWHFYCPKSDTFSGPQIRVCNRKLFYLFLNQNTCCGYSKEPSR